MLKRSTSIQGVHWRVPENPGACEFDEEQKLVSWGDWKVLVTYFIWLNNVHVHRSMVFAMRSLVEPEELVSFLLECLAFPCRHIGFEDAIEPAVIRQSVLSFIRMWLELAFQDFSPSTLSSLLTQLRDFMSSNEHNKIKLLGLRRKDFKPASVTEGEALSSPKEFPLPPLLSVAELVDGMLVIDKLLLLELNSKLLLNAKGNAVSVHFNRVSFGISSRLLSLPSRTQMGAEMQIWIEVASLLVNAHDFIGSMAIASGLICHDVTRLLLAQEMTPAHQVTLSQLDEMVAGANNYHILRDVELIHEGKSLIPFVPMHLRDLVTIRENASGKNFEALYDIGAIIWNVLHSQTNVTLPTDSMRVSPSTKYWLSLPFLSEADRMALSDKWKLAVPTDLPSARNDQMHRSLLVNAPNLFMKKKRQSSNASSRLPSAAKQRSKEQLKDPPRGRLSPKQDSASKEKSRLSSPGILIDVDALDGSFSERDESESGSEVSTVSGIDSTLELSFNHRAIEGAHAAFPIHRKAMKQLKYLGRYFRQLNSPTVTISSTMMEFMIEHQILYYDPVNLRDQQGRAILLMRPGNYYPGQMEPKEVVKLLMAFGQCIFATEQRYVFCADMRGWGASNFSISYAKSWFFAMQSLPIVIDEFVLVSPAAFFTGAFKLFRPFLQPSFREKFRMLPKDNLLDSVFTVESLPDIFGGSLVLDYDAMADQITSTMSSLDLIDDTYWDSFILPACLGCFADADIIHSRCPKCRVVYCQDCLSMVRLKSLGDDVVRPMCVSCIATFKKQIAMKKTSDFI